MILAQYGNSAGVVWMSIDNPVDDLAEIEVFYRVNGEPERLSYHGDSLEAARSDMKIRVRAMRNRHNDTKFTMTPNGS